MNLNPAHQAALMQAEAEFHTFAPATSSEIHMVFGFQGAVVFGLVKN